MLFFIANAHKNLVLHRGILYSGKSVHLVNSGKIFQQLLFAHIAYMSHKAEKLEIWSELSLQDRAMLTGFLQRGVLLRYDLITCAR